MILKHPIIIDRSRLKMKIEKGDSINRNNRKNNREICNKYFPYTVFERGEIIALENIKNIDNESSIGKYDFFF